MSPKAVPTLKLEALLDWYKNESRPLPWRRKKPRPYEVWISEIMSQQSTLKTVLPYFRNWMERFPSLSDLAEAQDEDVLKAWAGLGYYSRAKNLLKAARIIHASKKWPRTFSEWQMLPGVGPYTAKAVAAIAFSETVIPIDGNVIRVFSRLKGIADPLNLSKDRLRLESAVREIEAQLTPAIAPFAAQAFMELGARICRPRDLALCVECPIHESCRARSSGKVGIWPLKKERAAMREEKLLVHLHQSKKGAYLVTEIPKGQRLAGQWELPVESFDLAKKISHNRLLGPISHTITCHRYKAFAQFSPSLPKALLKGRRSRILQVDNPEERLLLTTLSRKVLDLWQSS